MTQPTNKHIMDTNTLVCSCGKTKEQHLNAELVNEKIQARWVSGDVNLKRDFAELDRVIKR